MNTYDLWYVLWRKPAQVRKPSERPDDAVVSMKAMESFFKVTFETNQGVNAIVLVKDDGVSD